MDNDFNILFGPKDGKSLLRMYPELAKEPCFKDLPADELNFVWYYANPSSSIDPEEPDSVRANMSAGIVFKKNSDKIKKFSSMSFDEPVKKAIERMKKYSPDARAMAKRIAQTTLNNYMKLVEVKVSDFEFINKDGIKEIDWSGRNQYVSSAAKINEVMPGLINQIEEGYGIETKGQDAAFKGNSAINVYHKQNLSTT